MDSAYFIYLLRCTDGSLYTGITTDYQRRLSEHGGKRGAKYTHAHPPSHFERVWRTSSRALASRLEHRLKTLTRAQKEQLVRDASQLAPLLAHHIDIAQYREEPLP